MTPTVREDLSRAELLLMKGEYRDALKLVETIAARKKLRLDDRLACLLLESRLRVKLGKLEEALVLVEDVLQTVRGRQNLLQIVDGLTVEAEVFWRSGRLDEGLKVLEESERLLAEIGMKHERDREEQIKKRKAEILSHKGIIYWYKVELDKALEHHQHSLAIKEELGNRKGIADSLNNLGLVYWYKGELDKALEHHQRSLAIHEELGDSKGISASLNNLGNVHRLKGELDKALEHHQRSLAIREELGNKQDMFRSLNNIGAVYRLKGELDKALEHYHRSLAIGEELGIKADIALVLHNLGDVYELIGELDKALEHTQRSLAIREEAGNKIDIAMSLNDIGSIYRKKGNFDQALENYQGSLTIYEEIGNDLFAAIVLSELVWFALDSNNPTLAQQYLQKLQQINERADNRIIDQRYLVAKAVLLKTSKRTRHRAEAEKIFEQVVEEEVTDHSLTVTAMIHLCDLWLLELKMTGDEEVLDNVKNLTNRLLDIAKQQSSHSLLAETYLLQSKLALIELDMGQAKRFLTKAHLITKAKGMHKLASAVEYERDSLQSQLNKWESIMEQKPSKQKMIDLTRLDDFLEQMIRKTVANLREEKAMQTVKAKEIGIRGWLRGSE